MLKDVIQATQTVGPPVVFILDGGDGILPDFPGDVIHNPLNIRFGKGFNLVAAGEKAKIFVSAKILDLDVNVRPVAALPRLAPIPIMAAL